MKDLSIISSAILIISPIIALVVSILGSFGLDKTKSDKFCHDIRDVIKQRKHYNIKKLIYIDVKRSDRESVDGQIFEILENFSDTKNFEQKLRSFGRICNTYNLFIFLSIFFGVILLLLHYVLKFIPDVLNQIFLGISLLDGLLIIIGFLVLFVKKESIRNKYENCYRV